MTRIASVSVIRNAAFYRYRPLASLVNLLP